MLLDNFITFLRHIISLFWMEPLLAAIF